MPTPFYHIYAADELLSRQYLPPKIQQLLVSQRKNFLFGCTAADTQTVSGQSRLETHFFGFPYRGFAALPWDELYRQYPPLAYIGKLEPEQAAFLAGYVCHLQADWLWAMDIFLPTFDGAARWAPFLQRMHLHNVLRAYLDATICPKLQPDVGMCLAQVEPGDWLPFLKAEHLLAWRTILVDQFQPGSPSRTVEVFAQRLGTSPLEFYRLLESEERMDEEIFRHLPRSRLDFYHTRLLSANTHVLSHWEEMLP